jgi:Beta-propeller repeat
VLAACGNRFSGHFIFSYRKVTAVYFTFNLMCCLLSLILFSCGSLWQLTAFGANLHAGDILVLDQNQEAVFLVDPASGARSILSSSLFGANVGTGPSMKDPYGVVADTMGNIYVTGVGNGGSVVQIDPLTGNRTLISSNTHGGGPAFQYPTSIASDTQGNLFVSDYDDSGLTFSRLLRVDRATGDRTIVSGVVSVLPTVAVGSGPHLDAPASIFIEPSGTIAVLDLKFTSHSWEILGVDPTTGNRTLVVQPSGLVGTLQHSASDVIRDASGNFFVSDQFSNLIARVDAATGAQTIFAGPSIDVPATTPILYPVGLAAEQSGNLLVTDHGLAALLRIDLLSGQQSIVSRQSIGGGPDFVDPTDIAVVPAQVAEPSSFVLLGLGVALLAARMKR